MMSERWLCICTHSHACTHTDPPACNRQAKRTHCPGGAEWLLCPQPVMTVETSSLGDAIRGPPSPSSNKDTRLATHPHLLNLLFKPMLSTCHLRAQQEVADRPHLPLETQAFRRLPRSHTRLCFEHKSHSWGFERESMVPAWDASFLGSTWHRPGSRAEACAQSPSSRCHSCSCVQRRSDSLSQKDAGFLKPL